jgi:ubiquitin carboxyl-terminal hydrolase 34
MILDLLKDQVPKNWVRFDQYFQFWRDLVDGGEVQLQFLQRRKVVTLFLDFMLEGNSPVKISEKKHTMGNPYYQPNFSTLFEVCLKFIKRCQTNPDEEFKLSYVDRVMLFSSRLIEKLLRSIKKQPLIAHYFVQMCFEDQLYSEIVCSCVLRSINTFS